jgi:hypothetical protein
LIFCAIDNSLYLFSEVLRKLKNLPDPPPEQAILRVLDAASQVEAVSPMPRSRSQRAIA